MDCCTILDKIFGNYAPKRDPEHHEFFSARSAHSASGQKWRSIRNRPALPVSRIPDYDQARRPDPDCPYSLGAITSIFFTIGHSTRTLEEFVDLIRESNIKLVVDVRSMPRSRTNPQFNLETLPEELARRQIGYEHIAELGGLRAKSRFAKSSLNPYWRVRSFRNYADYALTAPFAWGVKRLREMGHQRRCAIMCAEAVWWRCHRRIIADYLLADGEHVMHILGAAHVGEAKLTPGAVVRGDKTIVYPAENPPPD